MPKDHIERKTYRKSPGRQYGYDYDPLRSQNGQNLSSNAAQGSEYEVSPGHSGTLSAPRPDPRRTRQLLRKSIIASKTRTLEEELEAGEGFEEYPEEPRTRYQPLSSEDAFERAHQPARRYVSRPVGSRRLIEIGEEENLHAWSDLQSSELDPGESDFSDPDPLDLRLGYAPEPPAFKSARVQPARQIDDGYLDDSELAGEFKYSSDQPVGRLKRRKKKISRRGLLLGAGAVAVGGVGIAAYELAPRLPQTLSNVGSTIGHQVDEAFKKGLSQGADQARREFITSLDNLEGFSLTAAQDAARLTRVAYDVFVSPVINFGATVTGDVLTGLLKAFQTGRHWLVNIGQDNATLEAIEKVLSSWVDQVTKMPKQLDAITQTDLDGAQAYLRALQHKIEDEKAKLNNPTPTPAATPTAPTKTTPK
ncbi:hypothetical protein [Tengunoibacter tsumagoiensis]|uniref:Uncharacterized protein n=1 Tax=Tengunoibacter tsumagoiensis TaxID=2014871 RepID=A0A401ZW39_9CHLR|nr:hypothetical protein [Tengunoibacter tsumagoiensis]GCE11121.1 hypothetical protein KTT_09800 [Tengunoibacter tsumagoiensis]